MQDSFLQAMEIALDENVDRLSHKMGHFAKLFAHGKKNLMWEIRKKDWVFFMSFILSSTTFLVCLILLKY